MVYSMSLEDPGGASFAGIGGLGEQVRELREVIELPLLNPELFTVRSNGVWGVVGEGVGGGVE